MNKHRILRTSAAAILAVAGVLTPGATLVRAADTAALTAGQRLEKLEQENADLRKRLEALEQGSASPTAASATGIAGKTQEFLGKTEIGGAVVASYFYDTSKPDGGSSPGLTFTANHDSFTLNKVHLWLQKPVKTSPDQWDGGYRVDLIWGDDAPILNTGPSDFEGFEALRQAYVEANAPVGNGLNIKAGQLISLLNFESGHTYPNPNFSQGNQWFFTGNGPGAGVQLGYAFNEKIDAQVRVQNGIYAGARDNNSGKAFMARLGYKPDAKSSVALLGFAGEGDGGASDWLTGASLIATRNFTDKLHGATELDYFNADSGAAGSSEWYSAGVWLWYDFTEKLGLAARADYVGDPDGAASSGLLGFPSHTGQDLYSLTLTLNFTPVSFLQFRPEIRYDKTSLDAGFAGQDDRLSIGMGVAYIF